MSVFSFAFEAILFGLIGLGIEVIFTGLLKEQHDDHHHPRVHAMGHSSVWYFILYAETPFVLHGMRALGLIQSHFLLRAFIYSVVIRVSELLWMYILRRLLGSSPSERSYYKRPYNFRGLIRLDPLYLCVWPIVGLLLEQLHSYLHALPNF